jgi:hypothetical protein
MRKLPCGPHFGSLFRPREAIPVEKDCAPTRPERDAERNVGIYDADTYAAAFKAGVRASRRAAEWPQLRALCRWRGGRLSQAWRFRPVQLLSRQPLPDRCFRGGHAASAAAAPSLLGGRAWASDAIQWRATGFPAGPRAACVRRGKRYAGGNGACMARARCGSSSGTPACCAVCVYWRLADNLPCVGQPSGCQKMCAIMYCCANFNFMPGAPPPQA